MGEEPGSRKFLLHKKLLCHQSTFFDAAFGGSFREGNNKEMTLPEESLEAFDVFVHWLYTRELPTGDELAKLQPGNHALPLLRLLIMADKILIPALQSAAYDSIPSHYGRGAFPRPENVTELYNHNDLAVSQIVRYFVKIYVYGIGVRRKSASLKTLSHFLGHIPQFDTDVAK